MDALRVTPDRLSVVLEGPVEVRDLDALLDAVMRELARLQLAEPPVPGEVRRRLREALGPEGKLNRVVVAEGRSPVPPEDGRIEWAGDFFNAGFVINEATGAIDYRRRAAQVSVANGQLLARVHPPRDGTDGQDLFGLRMPAGKGRKARLRAGGNVRTEADGTVFYAAATGRVRLTGDVLSVDEVFTVAGSVGLATGHIDHPGALIVEQDIEAGSEVAATGDIEVHGVVESAQVSTAGSLTVRGGIIGSAHSTVRAGGQVHAKFLRDARVEAGGDVVIEKEVLHSIVKTQGAFQMPRGRLVGGETVARNGVDVHQAGSEALVSTVIAAGEDFQESDDVRGKERRVAELEMTLARIQATVEAVAPQAESLPPARRQALEDLESQAQALARAVDDLRAELQALGPKEGDGARARVRIRGTLHPEVVLRICGDRLRVSEVYPGPVQAVLTGDGVTVLPMRGEP